MRSSGGNCWPPVANTAPAALAPRLRSLGSLGQPEVSVPLAAGAFPLEPVPPVPLTTTRARSWGRAGAADTAGAAISTSPALAEGGGEVSVMCAAY